VCSIRLSASIRAEAADPARDARRAVACGTAAETEPPLDGDDLKRAFRLGYETARREVAEVRSPERFAD
jgi:hypothetical protein